MDERERALENMVRPARAFWREKRVFLTGHTGFKGAWLALWLSRWGARVTGYALPPPTNPSLFEDARVGDVLASHIGDIRDLSALTAVMRAANPEIVLHLAAQPLVRRSYREPIETYTTNVIGTANVLEAARQCPDVRVAVVVTSDKCYENREWPWGYREIDRLGGHDPYSSSKGCAEIIASAYARSFLLTQLPARGVATVRAGNVIGGGDWAEDRLVPDLMKAFRRGEVVRIRNPNASRPWQHVLEPLAGYLTVAEKLWAEPLGYSEAWNFGPYEEDVVRVDSLVELAAKSWGSDARWVVERDPNDVHESTHLRLDWSKAHGRLGWRPVWRLQQAIHETAGWYAAHLAGSDAGTLCNEQIERFVHHVT